jgi:hypothetical protein
MKLKKAEEKTGASKLLFLGPDFYFIDGTFSGITHELLGGNCQMRDILRD